MTAGKSDATEVAKEDVVSSDGEDEAVAVNNMKKAVIEECFKEE